MKLVRDNIPDIIEKTGKKCVYRVADPKEYQRYLYEKMREELTEFVEDPCIEEAADMYEVFLSILRFHKLDICDVIFTASSKKEERGGFLNGIILETVE